MGRSAAYRWMANTMALRPEEAHIGRLSIAQCEQLIGLVRRVIPEGRSDLTPDVPYPYCLDRPEAWRHD